MWHSRSSACLAGLPPAACWCTPQLLAPRPAIASQAATRPWQAGRGSSPRKLALPVHRAAATILLSLGDRLHGHLRAVGEWRARHGRRAAAVAVQPVIIVGAVAAGVARAGLALRLALRARGGRRRSGWIRGSSPGRQQGPRRRLGGELPVFMGLTIAAQRARHRLPGYRHDLSPDACRNWGCREERLRWWSVVGSVFRHQAGATSADIGRSQTNTKMGARREQLASTRWALLAGRFPPLLALLRLLPHQQPVLCIPCDILHC